MTASETWSAERFFWAILDAPGIRSGGELPVGLQDMLAEEAPIDPTELHAVYAPISDGRVAVCAARRSELHALPPNTLGLVPASVPDFLGGLAQAEQFNLLVGRFEPMLLRSARTRRHTMAALATLISGLLIATGLFRRANHWQSEVSQTTAIIRSTAQTITGSDLPKVVSAELRRLRDLHAAASQLESPPDAAVALSEILAAWPTTVPHQPTLVSASPAGVMASISMNGDATELLDEFHPPTGWTLDEPRLYAVDRTIRLNLSLRKRIGAAQ